MKSTNLVDKYGFIHASLVRKPISRHLLSKIKPIQNEVKHPTTHLSSFKSSHTTSTTDSNHPSSLSKTRSNPNDTNQYDHSMSAILLPSVKTKSASNINLQDSKNIFVYNKIRCSKRLAISLGIIIVLCILILALSLTAMIFSIFAFDRLPTASTVTTTTTTLSLRWMSAGITVAGIGNVSGIAVNQLNAPADFALDSSGSLYITDYFNNRIQQWLQGAQTASTIAGSASGISGSTSTTFNLPTGIVMDSSNNIYVSDSNNQRVQLWNNGASSGTTIAGTTGSSGSSNTQLNFPYSITFGSNTNTFYVADFFNHRVMSYSLGSLIGTVVAGGNGPGTNNNQLSSPVGIYFDASSNSLLISNYGAHTIVRWILGASNATVIIGTPGISGSSSTMLNSPTGVILDSIGNMYVADSNNHRIQFFLSGQSSGTTIAGVTNIPGPTSGLLCRPYTVRLDNQFNLYVADTFNNRIQKFLRY